MQPKSYEFPLTPYQIFRRHDPENLNLYLSAVNTSNLVTFCTFSGYPTLSAWSLVPLWQGPVRVRNSPGSRCHSDSQPMSYKNLGFTPPLLLWHHYPQEAKRIAPPVICQAPHCCAPITSFPLTPTKATLHVQANSFLCGAISKRNINPALYAAVGSHMSPGDVHTTLHVIGRCLFFVWHSVCYLCCMTS